MCGHSAGMRSISVTMISLGFGSTMSLTENAQHSASQSTKKPTMKAVEASRRRSCGVHHAASLAGRAETMSSRSRCVMVTNAGV